MIFLLSFALLGEVSVGLEILLEYQLILIDANQSVPECRARDSKASISR